MKKSFKKSIKMSLCAGILAAGLLLGYASISLAAGGMDMGGSQSQQQDSSMKDMPGMDSNSVPGGQHEATSGMDPNMPGMKSEGQDSGQGGSEGVNWYVVGGFLIINFIVIGSAGILKFIRKVPVQ